MRAASVALPWAPAQGDVVRGGPPTGEERDAGLSAREIRLDLCRALEGGELEVRYQPILELAGLGLWGCEALCRWRHPEHGPIPAARFIPQAEESRLIVPLGAWVLAESCRSLARWRDAGLVGDELVLSVNVSALQLAERSFVDEVEGVLECTGVPAHCLQLEVTERVAVGSLAAVQGLRELGVRLALDDFGKGYCSLDLLRRLPVDVLKVDRSFTRDLATSTVAESLVRTIFFLADHLDQEVIIEGVETAQQLRLLREMGCGLGQGYLFADSLSADQLAAVARARREALTFDPAKALRSSPAEARR